MEYSDLCRAHEIALELAKIEKVVSIIEVEEGEEDPLGEVTYINAGLKEIQIHATFLVEGLNKQAEILRKQLRELGVKL